MALAAFVDLPSLLKPTVNVPIPGNVVQIADLRPQLPTRLETLTISITEIPPERLGRLMETLSCYPEVNTACRRLERITLVFHRYQDGQRQRGVLPYCGACLRLLSVLVLVMLLFRADIVPYNGIDSACGSYDHYLRPNATEVGAYRCRQSSKELDGLQSKVETASQSKVDTASQSKVETASQ